MHNHGQVYSSDQENRGSKTTPSIRVTSKASVDPQSTSSDTSNIFFDELQRQLKQHQLENIPHNEDLVTSNKLLQVPDGWVFMDEWLLACLAGVMTLNMHTGKQKKGYQMGWSKGG